MKISVAIEILKELKRANEKMTLQSIAGSLNISTRSVGRYLNELTCCGVPIRIERGRYGGIRLDGEIF